jgi:hypothetical protein
MQYAAELDGRFAITPVLSQAHKDYLLAFARTRRVQRDPDLLRYCPDPKREAVGLSLAVDGGFFIGQEENSRGPDITDYNKPPLGQPGLWCQWVPSSYASAIEWDGIEKFESYVEWLEFLVEALLKPWGYEVNGTVKWFGEDHDDFGIIVCENNRITVKRGKISYT